MKTSNNVKDINTLKDLFGFSNLNEYHEIFSNQNEKVVGKFEIETPKKNWLDDFFYLQSKAYSFKCNDKYTIKLGGV